MSQAVPVVLSQDEKKYLCGLVRLALENAAKGNNPLPLEELPQPADGPLKEPMGVFVTYSEAGSLRGCIGTTGPVYPLWEAVATMAWAAARKDPRFSPVGMEELPAVSFEITVLGAITKCPDYKLIELGRHGVLLESRGRQATFLPQVPVEQGWSVLGTLENLCRKANIPPGTWRDRTATIFWYEALIIKPEETEE